MLLFDGFGGLLVLGMWIFCCLDVLLTPESGCRNLPKLAWVFLVLLLPLVGPIAWPAAGGPGDRPGRGVAEEAWRLASAKERSARLAEASLVAVLINNCGAGARAGKA